MCIRDSGRVAFMTDGVSHLTTIKEGAPDLNFDFMKLPVMEGFDGESGMDVANWGIGIADNCENKKEAMQFVEYLMSPEVNAKLSELANALPGNSTAEPDYSKNDELFQNCLLYTSKRPEGYFAGKLIQDAGLQGFSVGGAQVSMKHCGFVINKDNATAADLSLIHISARQAE